MIVFYDSLICQQTSGMLSYCMIQWHVTAILGCDQTVGWTDKSVIFWDVIILWFCYMSKHFWNPAPSLTYRYPSRMWSCCRIHHLGQYICEMWSYCMFHWSVSTLLGVILLWDSLICKYTRGMWSYCRIHWYITTLLGCDSLVCWYTSTILHSIAA